MIFTGGAAGALMPAASSIPPRVAPTTVRLRGQHNPAT
jgi:hypothetical protein